MSIKQQPVKDQSQLLCQDSHLPAMGQHKGDF